MGICFVGKVGIREFLSQYVETQPGSLIANTGEVIGEHDGAIFYTVGQRHGLNVGGGMPYYVTGKEMKKNEVYVTNDIQDENLWSETINLTSAHWINQAPEIGKTYHVRTRHRAKTIACTFEADGQGNLQAQWSEPIRALTPGQSAVFYDENICIGGGIIV